MTHAVHMRHSTYGLVDIVEMAKHFIKLSLSLILVFWHRTSQRNLDGIKVYLRVFNTG